MNVMPLVPDWSVLSSSLDILILVMPMMDLSGAGGMIRPFCRYFSASLSRSPAVPQTESSNVRPKFEIIDFIQD
jgi:hypothetical protein